MSNLTTHVLDTSKGKPGVSMPVTLSRQDDKTGVWHQLAARATDEDGRIKDLMAGERLITGVYKLTFDTQSYFLSMNRYCFYPFVDVVFRVTNPEEHHHVPLLISPYGYSTYRGS